MGSPLQEFLSKGCDPSLPFIVSLQQEDIVKGLQGLLVVENPFLILYSPRVERVAHGKNAFRVLGSGMYMMYDPGSGKILPGEHMEDFTIRYVDQKELYRLNLE